MNLNFVFPFCKESTDYWQNGKSIQNAMPYLTADEREFIMTGITPEEWPFKEDE